MLCKGAGHRLGELRKRVKEGEILLAGLHSLLVVCKICDARIIFELVVVIMRSEIQLNKLGKLSDCRRKVTAEAEVTDIDERNPSVWMKLNARLVTPEVRILVKIPVRPFRPVLSVIIPVRTVKRFPNLLESELILKIFI